MRKNNIWMSVFISWSCNIIDLKVLVDFILIKIEVEIALGSNFIKSISAQSGLFLFRELSFKFAQFDFLSNKLIDFVYFGAYDLSVEYQIPGQIFEERILDDLRSLKKIAIKNNKQVMAIYRTKEELEILNNIGVNIPIASVDTSHLVNKLKAEYNSFKTIKKIDS